MVDQNPIGRTTRSNPASYVGAFDAIRELFAAEPAAQERKYTAGTFSFNSGNGRCPTCSGNGFEHVEMQFLSDVYLRCPDCNGRRYRDEVLDIRREGADGRRCNIADVLELTVTRGARLLRRCAGSGGAPDAARRRGPRVREARPAGADALRRRGAAPEARRPPGARPAPVLSSTTHRGKLFLFDEPTTGLHFEDVAKLLRAFRKLLAAGHSLLVIEHNLDVIRAADWIIDLGPEGGERGGELVCAGTPAQVRAAARSLHRPGAGGLRGGTVAGAQRASAAAPPAAAAAVAEPQPHYARVNGHDPNAIVIHKAREHNLKNIDVQIPRDRFTVITGVSGSGKSTLAFDILFNEGQRRYLESLNAYARQFVQPAARPDVDAIFGIPPTVAIEQRTSRGGRKSTVATLTEIYHFLRLLYVKLGTQYCPDCDVAIEPQSPASIAARLLRDYRGRAHHAARAARRGAQGLLHRSRQVGGEEGLPHAARRRRARCRPRPGRACRASASTPSSCRSRRSTSAPRTEGELHEALARALDFGKGLVHVLPAGRRAGDGVLDPARLSLLRQELRRARPAPVLVQLQARLVRELLRHGCGDAGVRRAAERRGDVVERVVRARAAAVRRLPRPAPERRRAQRALSRALDRRTRAANRSSASAQFFARLRLGTREREIARDLLAEIRARLKFLERVGLGYLQLDRAAPTLSGGEAQRIRLAAQLGSNLQGVCYVLDEPTIGLHPRDNASCSTP